MTNRRVIVAFTGGGCDGEYLHLSGERTTRERSMARTFADEAAAWLWLGGELTGLNRPKRAVRLLPA